MDSARARSARPPSARLAATAGLAALVLTACGASATAEPTAIPPESSAQSTSVAPSSTTDTSPTPETLPTPQPATTTAPPAPYPDLDPAVVQRWVPDVLATYPHDPQAFTQGLVVRGNTVYESTGLYGESTVRIVDLATGSATRLVELTADQFGEGLALVDDRLIQLTWQEQTALVWDAATLTEIGRFGYEGEGWGLCYDGQLLVMSDGSATLTFRDPQSFAVVGEVDVTLDGQPLVRLNELECVDGLVLANVWLTTDIVVIDPESGRVTAVVDASTLDTVDDRTGGAVLNGIAYDASEGVFLVTGKLWPVMYEVRFVER